MSGMSGMSDFLCISVYFIYHLEFNLLERTDLHSPVPGLARVIFHPFKSMKIRYTTQNALLAKIHCPILLKREVNEFVKSS